MVNILYLNFWIKSFFVPNADGTQWQWSCRHHSCAGAPFYWSSHFSCFLSSCELRLISLLKFLNKIILLHKMQIQWQWSRCHHSCARTPFYQSAPRLRVFLFSELVPITVNIFYLNFWTKLFFVPNADGTQWYWSRRHHSCARAPFYRSAPRLRVLHTVHCKHSSPKCLHSLPSLSDSHY